jgi:hypothetical protein
VIINMTSEEAALVLPLLREESKKMEILAGSIFTSTNVMNGLLECKDKIDSLRDKIFQEMTK